MKDDPPRNTGDDGRRVGMLDVVRYPRSGSSIEVEVDGYPNFHHLTRPPFPAKRLLLEAGINRVAELSGPDGVRRPSILLRSSPWKFGHESNPWEDVFDVDHGHVRYFGDHKPTTLGPVGVTDGNRALLSAWELHGSSIAEERSAAPPLLLFRAVPGTNSRGETVQKGFVEFSGVAVAERLEYVVLDLSDSDDMLDWRWIDDRRDPSLSHDETLRHAPSSWRRWVKDGRVALPRVRRRVLSSRVKTRGDQQPLPGSQEQHVLDQIYDHFEGRKHHFEHLAASVAAQVFERSGASYHRGWLTRAGGDGGMDFVGRLDAGNHDANTPLVVLGQAKCVKPDSSISPDEVARVVARLRRGWLGIFVTTGSFSKQAQVEVIDDEYPIVLVAGRQLAIEVSQLAELTHGGDVSQLLAAAVDTYTQDVTHRRPEEIRSQA